MTPEERFASLDVTGARRDVVALGGTLDVEHLLAAYRHGVFPWPSDERDAPALQRWARRLVRRGAVPLLTGEDGLVPWCSPHPRAVLLPAQLHVPRSLRQRLRRCDWWASVDVAFDEVVQQCAARDSTWISARMRAAYGALHRAGHAHSVEVWDGPPGGGALIGGLYGVLVGQVFSGESMFHRVDDASKAALVDLSARLVEAGVVVLDTQQATAHLAVMGQVLVHREEYLEVVRLLRERPAVLPAQPGRLRDRVT